MRLCSRAVAGHMGRRITRTALQTDNGVTLAGTLINKLRRHTTILPALSAFERACAEAVTRANRRIYTLLNDSLSPRHRQSLDDLLKLMDGSRQLGWRAEAIAAQAKLSTHARTYRSVEDPACARSSSWDRAPGPSEPSSQDRPRGPLKGNWIARRSRLINISA
jgi:hypothetical protein